MSEQKSTGHGLLATSRYVPRLRIDRADIYARHRWMAPGLKSSAKGHRAVANWDEDSVTMAVEVARQLREAAPGVAPAGLSLASTTLPFAERLNAGIVAAALGMPEATVARDLVSGQRVALTELIDHLRRGSGAPQLVVAADRRIARPASAQEMNYGDGSAGALVGEGAAIATFVASRSTYADFVDRFRATGQMHDYGWEERWVRDEGYMKLAVKAIKACLAEAGVQPTDIAHFAMPAPLAKVNEAVAKKLGIRPEAVVDAQGATVGDLGTAQPLALLDVALRQAAPGALVLVAAFGNGSDALLLRRTDVPCPGGVPGAGKVEANYMKYLSFTNQLALDWGMRAEMDNKTALTAAWREHGRMANFEGGRCTACGTVQFPSTDLCVNPGCRAEKSQQPVSLAEAPAKVMSHTSDFLAYTPAPPFQFGHIDFDGGGRVLMEFADTDEGELEVGKSVRMVYRVKEFDARRGFRRYFWKATPVRLAD